MKVKELREVLSDSEIGDDEDVAVFLVNGPEGEIVKYGMDIIRINEDDNPIMIFVDTNSGKE